MASSLHFVGSWAIIGICLTRKRSVGDGERGVSRSRKAGKEATLTTQEIPGKSKRLPNKSSTGSPILLASGELSVPLTLLKAVRNG